MGRDGFQASLIIADDWDGLLAGLNDLNEQWVRAMKRVSPHLMIDLLRSTGEQVSTYLQSIDSYTVGPVVSWASLKPAPMWLHIAREYTERWHHQQQIREAVGRPLLTDPDWLAPVLATFVHGLPRAYSEVSAPTGTKIRVTISGPSGGTWSVAHTDSEWVLCAAMSQSRPPASLSTRLQKPDISVLSDEFLAEVQGMPQRNLAVELLQKLLKGEVSTRRRKNVVQARSFADMLEQTLRRYQNRAIEAAQVIEELIELAKEMREANVRGEKLGLSEDELAFYDALETNDSAVQVLGDETLRTIARELVETVRGNVTIDWTLRENVRAQLRVLVRRILRKHGYPPDKQEKATQTVLEQAEVLSEGWSA